MRVVPCIAFYLFERCHWDVIACFKGCYFFYYFFSFGSDREPFSGVCQDWCDDYLCSTTTRNGWMS
eukprot:785636-Ditylum_brightwellii.AAC.1